MDSNIFCSIEKEYNDIIFDAQNGKLGTEGYSNTDSQYDCDIHRTYVFKDFQDGLFYIDQSGVIMNVPNRTLFHLKSSVGIDTNKKGVIVIKAFRFTKINLYELKRIISYYTKHNVMLDVKIEEILKKELSKFLKLDGKHFFVFRLISFVSEFDITNNKIYFDRLLNGHVTKNIDNYNSQNIDNHIQGCNNIEILLKKEHHDVYYINIKDKVIPLYTSDTVVENKIKFKKGNAVYTEESIKNLEDYNIYVTEREAFANTDSHKQKNIKFNLEEKKLDVEEKKLNVELCKLASELKKLHMDNEKLKFEKLKLVIEKEKLLLDYKKSIINYKTEALKKELNTYNIVKDFFKTDNVLKDIIKTTFQIFKKGD